MVYRVHNIIEGQPTFDVPLQLILDELKPGGALKVLSPAERITDAQRRWYKGVLLPALVKADENGETIDWWDMEVKRQCGGLSFLKKEIFLLHDGRSVGRLTTRNVGVKNMTNFINEILSKSLELGWPVVPPDPEMKG